MNKESPLFKWLQTQPIEFVDNVNKNELLGNGEFSIQSLIELDELYNPEDIE